MKNYKICCYTVLSLLLIGCGRDREQIKKEQSYFYDANTAFDNGDFEKSTNLYKSFLKEVNNEDEPAVQFAYLQLARIYYSKDNFGIAKTYAEKVKDTDLFMELYLLEEETYVDYGPRGSSTEKEVKEIGGYGYSLKGKAKTILGLCYLKIADYKNAIENFEDIRPKAESYYYLGIAYGLKGDLEEQRNYFEKNIEKGTVGLIETTEWLNNNPDK